MSALEKAAREAVEAADNTELTRQIAAILAAQQLLTQQQPQQPAPVRREFNPGQWLVIGGVVVSVGLVGALFAVAIAIGATCATACLLILRGLYRDYLKGK
ncbi:hypothetical protein [Streptomyces sp. NPDC017958]|uniref:hypothetical protein n=1 Tax=Streptomyces sp. NPDC017958 TaxID=3365021 RepID=UPI0037B5FBFE